MIRFFEDIAPGEVHEAGPITLTREAIVAFATMYDPQPFHLDEAAGAASLLGGLAASGWHTCAVGMRLYYEAFVRHVASMGAPGLDEVRWLKPVFSGDALRIVVTIGEVRPSASRPDRGFVAVTLELSSPTGLVMRQRGPLIVARRNCVSAAAPAAAQRPPIVAATVPEPDPMLAAYLDEIEIGREVLFGTQIFTAELIVAFARLYDPQPFHFDPETARRSHFGGLIASGWQTVAFWMKHYIAARDRAAQSRRSAGLPVAMPGPSPGLSNLKWSTPVRPGDAISYGLRFTGTSRTSRPGWGLVEGVSVGRDADGVSVMSADARLLWPIAEAGQAAADAGP